MFLVLLAAAGVGYWVYKQRQNRESPECDALDAELEAIVDRQDQLVANLAAGTDQTKQNEWAQELFELERLFNEKATEQATLPDCEPWDIVSPE